MKQPKGSQTALCRFSGEAQIGIVAIRCTGLEANAFVRRCRGYGARRRNGRETSLAASCSCRPDIFQHLVDCGSITKTTK